MGGFLSSSSSAQPCPNSRFPPYDSIDPFTNLFWSQMDHELWKRCPEYHCMKTEKEAILELTDSVLHLVDDIILVSWHKSLRQREKQSGNTQPSALRFSMPLWVTYRPWESKSWSVSPFSTFGHYCQCIWYNDGCLLSLNGQTIFEYKRVNF